MRKFVSIFLASLLFFGNVFAVTRYTKQSKSQMTLVTPSKMEIAAGSIIGQSYIAKFGHNSDVDIASAPEDVWAGSGLYAFYPTTNQAMEAISTDINDTGSVLSSGTVTSGSVTVLIDEDATFISDGVIVCDVVINDTTGEYGMIESVDSEIQITVTSMTNASSVTPTAIGNSYHDIYRVASANSTGAGVLHVEGLTSNSGDWELVTETVVLNGQTDVDLINPFIRMYRASILNTGASDAAEGTISIQINGGGTEGAVIFNGDNQTQQAVFTVPSGKTAFFIQGYVGLSSTSFPASGEANFTWRAREFCGIFQVKGQITVNTGSSSWWQYEYGIPVTLPEKSDILVRCEEVSDDDTGVVAGMDIILIDN